MGDSRGAEGITFQWKFQSVQWKTSVVSVTRWYWAIKGGTGAGVIAHRWQSSNFSRAGMLLRLFGSEVNGYDETPDDPEQMAQG
jgi:hypothetical protein